MILHLSDNEVHEHKLHGHYSFALQCLINPAEYNQPLLACIYMTLCLAQIQLEERRSNKWHTNNSINITLNSYLYCCSLPLQLPVTLWYIMLLAVRSLCKAECNYPQANFRSGYSLLKMISCMSGLVRFSTGPFRIWFNICDP